uniref:Uncharacterized protein n=1 Tax=Anopheles funestus TaxID=62324 RepID=A0A182S1L9_ANOFN
MWLIWKTKVMANRIALCRRKLNRIG